MFVLNCPSCGHQSRVKFARMGAVATCVGCKQKFKVDSGTLIVVEDDPSEAIAAAPSPVTPAPAPAPAAPASFAASPAPAPAQPIEPPQPARPVEPAPAPRQPAAAPSPRAPRQKHRPAPAPELPTVRIDRPAPVARRSGGLNPAIVALFAVVALVLAGLLVFLLVTQQNAKKPAAAPQPVAVVTPKHTAPKPAAPEPKPTQPVKPQGPAKLALEELPAVSWVGVPLAEPIRPTPLDGAVQWHTWLTRDTAGGRALLQAILVTDSPAVHKTLNLHVQLLDDQRRAYAELKQTIPLPAARRGLHLHLPIPAEMMERYAAHVAQVTAGDEASGAAAIEVVESRTRLEKAEGVPVIRFTIRNPTAAALGRIRLAVEVLDAGGWPLGTWLGRVEEPLGPGAVTELQVTPKLPAGLIPWRVEVRGYGTRAP